MAGDDDSSDKQFEATQHKLREQRKKGNVFKSKDLTQLFTMIVGFVLLFVFSAKVYEKLYEMCMLFWGNIPDFENLAPGFIFFHAWRTLVSITVPALIALAMVAILIEVLQLGGPLFTTEPMKFKLEKLDPIKGLKNMFNVKSLFELGKNIFKVSVVGYIAWMVIKAQMPLLLGNIQAASKLAGFITVSGILWEFFWKSSLFLLIVSLLDFSFQRWKYMKDQRMSFKEMKDEYKNTEGDPLIKSKRRQKQMEMAQGRGGSGIGQVPDADFVVKNPEHIAMAIKYDEEMMKAPRVLAKGTELIAQQIIEIAEAHGIPVIENIPLSRALFRLVRVNQDVPAELYKAVAEVLIFVYKIKGKNFK